MRSLPVELDALGYAQFGGRREALSDRAAPWLYRITALELTRENKIDNHHALAMSRYLYSARPSARWPTTTTTAAAARRASTPAARAARRTHAAAARSTSPAGAVGFAAICAWLAGPRVI